MLALYPCLCTRRLRVCTISLHCCTCRVCICDSPWVHLLSWVGQYRLHRLKVLEHTTTSSVLPLVPDCICCQLWVCRGGQHRLRAEGAAAHDHFDRFASWTATILVLIEKILALILPAILSLWFFSNHSISRHMSVLRAMACGPDSRIWPFVVEFFSFCIVCGRMCKLKNWKSTQKQSSISSNYGARDQTRKSLDPDKQPLSIQKEEDWKYVWSHISKFVFMLSKFIWSINFQNWNRWSGGESFPSGLWNSLKWPRRHDNSSTQDHDEAKCTTSLG